MQGERFKHLAERFLARTREEHAQLLALLPAARSGDADALLTLQHMVHRINGSGAMLGFREISGHAARIEHILRRSDNKPAETEWPVILAHVDKLANELRDNGEQPEDTH